MTRFERLRLLLIDPDPREAKVLQQSLATWEEIPFEVECLDGVAEAVARLADGGQDAVLLDVSPQGSGGLEAFHQVHRSVPELPIIVLADPSAEDTALQAVRAGAHDYLLKNRDGQDVMGRVIRHAVERARTSRQTRLREEQLRLLTEQLPCVFWTTDSHFRFTSWVGTVRFGAPNDPGQMTGKLVSEVFDHDRPAQPLLEAHRQAAAGRSVTLETHSKRRIYHVRVEPFRRPDGPVVGTIGLAIDITDQRLTDIELRHTRRIHAAMLPSAAPVVEGWEIAGASSSSAEAGGDYFDYFPLQDGSIGVVVCDVGGHGLGPAMMMCHARAYVRALAMTHAEPGEILSRVNRFLCDDIQEERLVTLFLAKLAPGSRSLVYANAGHQAYLYAADGRRLLLGPTGIPLNVLSEATVETAAPLTLESGDLLVLYTDGIVDSLDPEGQPFGVERLLDVLQRAHELPVAQIVDEIFRAVREFSSPGRLIDDMTAVVLRVG